MAWNQRPHCRPGLDPVVVCPVILGRSLVSSLRAKGLSPDDIRASARKGEFSTDMANAALEEVLTEQPPVKIIK